MRAPRALPGGRLDAHSWQPYSRPGPKGFGGAADYFHTTTDRRAWRRDALAAGTVKGNAPDTAVSAPKRSASRAKASGTKASGRKIALAWPVQQGWSRFGANGLATLAGGQLAASLCRVTVVLALAW